MIGRLRGTVVEAGFSECLVDVNGVGYQVQIPLSTFEKLPQSGGEATLRIHTQVREDAITLYGFATAEEKALFELLITVNMIGGKVALAVLSAMPVENFCRAVTQSDLKILGRIPGIGKRTAERIVVELRDKLGHFLTGGKDDMPSDTPPAVNVAIEDALAAFEQLGFKRENTEPELRKLAMSLRPEECSTENLLRRALLIVNQKQK